MTAPWPRSILPADRDGRFNWLMDAICGAYRELPEGHHIEYLAVKTAGEGVATLIVKDSQGLRRITITDERVA